MIRRYANPDLLAERDHMRESDGSLTVNGVALGILGSCACGCRMYTRAEADAGCCVDCGRGERRAAVLEARRKEGR